MVRTAADVLDLGDIADVDDLLRVAREAADRSAALGEPCEIEERMRALEDMCAALDEVRRRVLPAST